MCLLGIVENVLHLTASFEAILIGGDLLLQYCKQGLGDTELSLPTGWVMIQNALTLVYYLVILPLGVLAYGNVKSTRHFSCFAIS